MKGLLLQSHFLLLTLLHVPSRILPRGSTDCQPINLDSRNSDADWHSLAILAAGADALVKLQIVADHRNARQHIGSVSD
jgi:hypothetical protein